MILFGWGHTKEKDHGETFPLHCPNCNNDTFLRYKVIKLYFTLFFIPIFPYKTKHLLLCSICGVGKEFESTQIEDVKKMNEITKRFLNNEMEEQEYKKNSQTYGKKLFD
jgi:hypothetical protein